MDENEEFEFALAREKELSQNKSPASPSIPQSIASRVVNLAKATATAPLQMPKILPLQTGKDVLKAGAEADKVYPAENLLPTAGAVTGAMVGGAATLPTGAGVPFGATIGAAEGGAVGETAKNYIRALRGKTTPETPIESLKQSGTEGAKQGAAELGGAGIASALEKVFVGLPRVLMNKVMNVSNKRLQAEALGKAEEIGAKAANEWANAGKSSSEILDRIKTETPKIGKQISKAVEDTYKTTNATVPTDQFFDEAITPMIEKLKPNPTNKPIIKNILDLKKDYLDQYGPTITLPQLEKLKISLYDDIADSAWWKANEALPDKVKATVALARTARQKISDLIPGISDLNFQYGLYSSMKAFLAGTEAGGGKSVIKLFVEPGYEKALTATAVPVAKLGAKIKVFNPAIPTGTQMGALGYRGILQKSGDETQR